MKLITVKQSMKILSSIQVHLKSVFAALDTSGEMTLALQAVRVFIMIFAQL